MVCSRVKSFVYLLIIKLWLQFSDVHPSWQIHLSFVEQSPWIQFVRSHLKSVVCIIEPNRRHILLIFIPSFSYQSHTIDQWILSDIDKDILDNIQHMFHYSNKVDLHKLEYLQSKKSKLIRWTSSFVLFTIETILSKISWFTQFLSCIQITIITLFVG